MYFFNHKLKFLKMKMLPKFVKMVGKDEKYEVYLKGKPLSTGTAGNVATMSQHTKPKK